MRSNSNKINSLSGANKTQAGSTIIEMVIALVIFLIVTGSIYGLLTLGTVSKNRSGRKADVLKNARTAIHLIGRDALNAGLGYHRTGGVVPDDFISTSLEVSADTNSYPDLLTSIIAGNNLFANDLQDPGDDNTDIIAFAYGDPDFDTAYIDQPAVPETTPTAVRLRLDGTSTTGNMRPFDLVLVETGDGRQVAGMISTVVNTASVELDVNDPLDINLAANGTGAAQNPLATSADVTALKRFFWVSYRVKQDGTLVRITYGNNRDQAANMQIQERPLAYNVKDLQFSYVLRDGTVTDDPGAGPDGITGTADDTPNNFNLIRQVSVTIEVQATELDEQTRRADSVTLNGTFSTRNLEYDIG